MPLQAGHRCSDSQPLGLSYKISGKSLAFQKYVGLITEIFCRFKKSLRIPETKWSFSNCDSRAAFLLAHSYRSQASQTSILNSFIFTAFAFEKPEKSRHETRERAGRSSSCRRRRRSGPFSRRRRRRWTARETSSLWLPKPSASSAFGWSKTREKWFFFFCFLKTLPVLPTPAVGVIDFVWFLLLRERPQEAQKTWYEYRA